MLPGIHIITANALALNLTKNPIGGLLLGIVFHHLGDILPHKDLNVFQNYNEISIKQLPKNLKLFLVSELSIGLLFSFIYFVLFFKKSFLLFLFISLGAVLPDLITIFFKKAFEKYGFGRRYINFHKKFHFKLKDKSFKTILLLQIYELFFIILSLIFFHLSNNFV